MPTFLSTRQTQKVIKELENEKVWYENQLLLNKMTKIEKKKGKLNPYNLVKKYWRPSMTHVGVNTRRMERRVGRENQVKGS